MPRTATRLLPAAAAILVVAALAGCSAAPGRPVEDYSGEPKGIDAPASSAGGASWAAWLDGGDRFAIVLYGSSTCPPKVANVTASADDTITATLAPAPGGICTRDYVPHTTVFATPDRIAKGTGVNIVLPDSTLTLPADRG
ncbi:hypothetical protein [Leifsonia sp. 1010]|uniref:hypothetical protein n=1 Tax=Leifsonia sp. 1010 TaxID=2817769 RepID=UPI002863C9FB|nr:hypothetical protein [Leifsonia sp. 1010]MDR6610738.1 hypothetical protein [Leifsonia sp. 1010]